MKKILTILFLFVLLFSMTIPAFANSAEPPGMTIISNDLPQGAVLTLVTPEGETLEFRQITRSEKAWESQHRLWFPLDFKNWNGAKLCVTVGNDSFTCSLPEMEGIPYRVVVTLDYKNQTLTLGQSPWRQPVLTAIRISLTLLCEGLVFLAFGFRQKRTWIVFLLLNLLTQGWLNYVINGYAFTVGYWMLVLYGVEFVIFAAEALVVGLLAKEHKPIRRVICALASNAVSLAVGMLLISNLPI